MPARPRRVQGAAGGGGQGMWAARRVHGGMQTHPAFKTHPPVVVATRDQRLAGGELVQRDGQHQTGRGGQEGQRGIAGAGFGADGPGRTDEGRGRGGGIRQAGQSSAVGRCRCRSAVHDEEVVACSRMGSPSAAACARTLRSLARIRTRSGRAAGVCVSNHVGTGSACRKSARTSAFARACAPGKPAGHPASAALIAMHRLVLDSSASSPSITLHDPRYPNSVAHQPKECVTAPAPTMATSPASIGLVMVLVPTPAMIASVAAVVTSSPPALVRSTRLTAPGRLGLGEQLTTHDQLHRLSIA